MKNCVFVVACVLGVAACSSPGNKETAVSTVKAPVAPTKPYTITSFGQKREDEYYWLKERESQQTLDYLNAENAYTDTILSPVRGLQEDLFKEMKARIKEDDSSVPVRDGAWYYNLRYKTGEEYAVHYRMKELGGKEQILFNENELASGLDYFDLGSYEVNDIGDVAAYTIDTVSRRLYTIRLRNLETGTDVPGVEIKNVDEGSMAWSADGNYLFYVLKNTTTLLGYQVRRFNIHTKEDVAVYTEKDQSFYIGLERTRSKKYIEIGTAQTGVATEIFLLDASKPTGEFVSLAGRTRGNEYSTVHDGDRFLIKTNVGGAVNFKIMVAPDVLPSPVSGWKEMVPHRSDVLIENIVSFKNYVALSERKAGLMHVRYMGKTAKGFEDIAFKDPTYAAGIVSTPEYDATKLRYYYSSLTTPASVYDFDMATGKTELMKQQPVLGSFNQANYVSERIEAKASDGTLIPISLVYRKGFSRNGKAPLLQYGYGSYGNSIDATFSSTRLSLLDRGFVFAICHIRGGEEMGRQWYLDGKLMKKKNTFTDFIACADHLKEQQYCAPDKLFAMGGSAGGLLMGAIANMAGDKYRGIVAQVPFVDVVTTMQDTTIPLTTNEFEEWGNPITDKAAFEYMLSYSPYDNVTKKAYPPMFISTGLHDSQVQYWEPAKWVARLRTKKTDKNPLLLHTDMEAGHGGASGRFKALREYAREYAFMFMLLGMTDGISGSEPSELKAESKAE
jgi:oligopeptidase B